MINQYFKPIKNWRIKKDLKQEEIAKKLGISRSSYISFEQGKTELNFSQIKQIDSRKDFYSVQNILGEAAQKAGVPRIWFDDNWGDRQNA